MPKLACLVTSSMTSARCLWSPPPIFPSLCGNDVHVWCAHLDSAVFAPWLAPILSPDERARALRFRFDHHRTAYVTGRGMLRLLLGRYLDSDPARLSFVPSPMGKPALAVEHNRDSIRFNVSHSNDLVLYAVTRDQEVGVDLEHVRPLADMEKIAKRFFTARECAVLELISPEARETAFYTCWTRKEAYLKALGGGLFSSP